MLENALYYPHIHFQNPDLIKSMAFFYSNIYRIIPDSIYPYNDHIDLQPLLEEGLVGKGLSPNKYIEEASIDFLASIKNWKASAICSNEDPSNINFTAIHAEKMDYKVKHLFENIGYERNDWLYVPTELASNYMLYLAKIMAKKNNLELLTDEWGAWTGTTYFNSNGKLDNLTEYNLKFLSEHTCGLFYMIVTNIVPIDIANISADKIVKFREKRHDEIKNLKLHIYDLQGELKKVEDNDIQIDLIKKKIKELAKAKKNYQKSADFLNVKGWTGIASYGFAAAIALGNILKLEPYQMLSIFSSAIAIGGIASFGSRREDLNKLNKESVGSCLFQMDKEFRNVYQRSDLNHYAYNCLEEYVND